MKQNASNLLMRYRQDKLERSRSKGKFRSISPYADDREGAGTKGKLRTIVTDPYADVL